MTDEKMRNIAITLLAITGLILLLFRKEGKELYLGSFVALAIILGLTLMAPVLGFMLAIPIALVVWFDHHQKVLDWWAGVQKATLKVGGDNQ